MKIEKQVCDACRGLGTTMSPNLRIPCVSCGASGVRFVPDGYTQQELDTVRSLVDALAIRQGLTSEP